MFSSVTEYYISAGSSYLIRITTEVTVLSNNKTNLWVQPAFIL